MTFVILLSKITPAQGPKQIRSSLEAAASSFQTESIMLFQLFVLLPDSIESDPALC